MTIPRLLLARRRANLPIAILVLSGLAYLALGNLPTTKSRPSSRQVWLIGWDGMAPWIVAPMIAANKLPNLKRLIDSGSAGELQSLAPAQSPALWTSIATGKLRQDHGVTGFWKKDPETGIEGLYSVLDRTAAPLWQIADQAGLTSDVIGWWVTWPAAAIRGSVVSDRYAPSRFKVHPKSSVQGSLYEALFTPPSLAPDLEDCLRTPEQISTDEMAQLTSGSDESSGTWRLHNRLDELRMAFARDETHWCIAKRLVERDFPDFLGVHLQGTDIVNHYFLKYRYPELWKERSKDVIPPEEMRRYKNTIENYYVWQDRRLGELLSLARPNTVIFVLSDHGFRVGSRPRVPSVSGVHGKKPAPPGFLVVSGPGIREGKTLHGAHILDIAPTVLSIWNLPVARDLPGKVLMDALIEPPSPHFVDSYGDGRSSFPDIPGPADLEVDSRVIQSLKSLGYVN